MNILLILKTFEKELHRNIVTFNRENINQAANEISKEKILEKKIDH